MSRQFRGNNLWQRATNGEMLQLSSFNNLCHSVTLRLKSKQLVLKLYSTLRREEGPVILMFILTVLTHSQYPSLHLSSTLCSLKYSITVIVGR